MTLILSLGCFRKLAYQLIDEGVAEHSRHSCHFPRHSCARRNPVNETVVCQIKAPPRISKLI